MGVDESSGLTQVRRPPFGAARLNWQEPFGSAGDFSVAIADGPATDGAARLELLLAGVWALEALALLNSALGSGNRALAGEIRTHRQSRAGKDDEDQGGQTAQGGIHVWGGRGTRPLGSLVSSYEACTYLFPHADLTLQRTGLSWGQDASGAREGAFISTSGLRARRSRLVRKRRISAPSGARRTRAA